MPIYEFRCLQCGHIQEMLFSSSTNRVEMICEACGGDQMERVLSRVSYVMGGPPGEGAKVTTKSCGQESSCATIELPGHKR